MHRSAVVALFFLCLTAGARASDLAFERAVAAALASPILPADIVENARDACDAALCFAETLARDLPESVRLEKVAHPDTDTIRWVTTPPSVIAERTGGTLELKITHFGRKAVTELRELLTSTRENKALVFDLAGNQGGDFERMLQLAGLLLGSRRDVVEIDYGDRIERRSLNGPLRRDWQVAGIQIDGATASAALLLARLVSTHTGIRLSGPAALDDPVFLKRRIPIDHDWRLILPVAEVRVIAP